MSREKTRFVNFRMRKDTHDQIRIIAALHGKSMSATMADIAAAEYARLQLDSAVAEHARLLSGDQKKKLD
jgi:hypothetical protein